MRGSRARVGPRARDVAVRLRWALRRACTLLRYVSPGGEVVAHGVLKGYSQGVRGVLTLRYVSPGGAVVAGDVLHVWIKTVDCEGLPIGRGDQLLQASRKWEYCLL